MKGQLQKAADKGDMEAYEQLEKQLVSDRKTLAAELEERRSASARGRTEPVAADARRL